MHTQRRHAKSMVVAGTLVAALALVLIPAGQASAGGFVTCAAQGYAIVTPATAGTYTWSIAGAGLCIGDLRGPYSVTVKGNGTSTGLGLCDGLLVRNLSLGVTMHLFSGVSGGRSFDETWSAPVTTFPLATPFLINDSGGSLIGAGAIQTRTRLACPPKGIPTAVFEWTQLKS